MAGPALPEITEIKETLTGARQTFRCRVVDRAAGQMVVLFVSDRPRRVHDVELPAGTVTFGYFWADRGYNVYHWMTPEGRTLAHYFNIADRTMIDGDLLSFRDLVVDVLVTSTGLVVLDEAELPPDLDPPTRDSIRRSVDALGDATAAVAEVEAASHRHWRVVFGWAR